MNAVSIRREGLDERCAGEILSKDAISFLAELHGRFDQRRQELLAARRARQQALNEGGTLDFLQETAEIREDSSWRVAPTRSDYEDRRVEITGPTDRKLVINALNSGAKGFMADFEDANSPTWHNQVSGHANLIDAIEGTISYESSEGKHYSLNEQIAVLLVRPRGLHLPEQNIAFDGLPASGALVDFGLFAFHSAPRLLARDRGAYLYLPKLEHHHEARFWAQALVWAEDALGLPQGTFRATVLVETLPAAFQMEEILFELRDHSYGMNAGRWDYIFSVIKSFRERPEFVMPDRTDVKMTVPFMRAYTELLVATCHKRGAFAMGGMAALIPSRTDAEANARAVSAVQADKQREAGNGFDGTWVAHPDVVAVAEQAFDAVLGERPNQIERQREEVHTTGAQLLAVAQTPGEITEQGLRTNINVGFQYISFWLGGRGAVGLNNLMEDAATAEISRAQIWQWIRHGAKLKDGRSVTKTLVQELLAEEMQKIRLTVDDQTWQAGRPAETQLIFEQVCLAEDFPDFLTLPGYELLEDRGATDDAALPNRA